MPAREIEWFAQVRSLDFRLSSRKGMAGTGWESPREKFSSSACPIAVARVMFHRERGTSRQIETQSLSCRSILSLKPDWEEVLFLCLSLSIYLPSIYPANMNPSQSRYTPGQSRYQRREPIRWLTSRRRAVQRISVEYSNPRWWLRHVIRTFKESDTYLSIYAWPICESNGIGRRVPRSPAGLFAGRWTWLFCGPGTTAIYTTLGD